MSEGFFEGAVPKGPVSEGAEYEHTVYNVGNNSLSAAGKMSWNLMTNVIAIT